MEGLFGVNRAFSGVVIDPVPAGIRKSGNFDDLEIDSNHAEDNHSDSNETQKLQQQQLQHQHRNSPIKSRKSSLVHPRQPVIPLSDVKITPDGNLAHQLECLADRAEAELKKLMQNKREEKDMKPESDDRSHDLVTIMSAEKR